MTEPQMEARLLTRQKRKKKNAPVDLSTLHLPCPSPPRMMRHWGSTASVRQKAHPCTLLPAQGHSVGCTILYQLSQNRLKQPDHIELRLPLSFPASLLPRPSLPPSSHLLELRAEPMADVCVLVAAERRVRLRRANVSKFTAADSETLISH